MKTLIDFLTSTVVATVLLVCTFYLDLRLARVELAVRECRHAIETQRPKEGIPSITVPGPYPPVLEDRGILPYSGTLHGKPSVFNGIDSVTITPATSGWVIANPVTREMPKK